MNYSPKNYKEKLSLIDEISENVHEISNEDFSSCIDADMEGAEYFPDRASKAIRKAIGSAESASKSLREDLLSDIERDFSDSLDLYVIMVKNGVEESESFPFDDWLSSIDFIKEGVKFPFKDIFSAIQSVNETNKDLAVENLAEYLNAIKSKLNNPEMFFPSFEEFLKKNFPQADMLSVLSASNYGDFVKGVNGKHVESNEKSKLFFQYAAELPNNNWTFKEISKNKGFGGLEVSVSTSNYDEIFEQFTKMDVWKRIVDQKLETKFLDEITSTKRVVSQFFKIKRSSMYSGVAEIKFENAEAFVRNVTKGNMELTEHFANNLMKAIPSYKRDELSPNMSANIAKLIKISLHEKLENEMSERNIKEKKMKI